LLSACGGGHPRSHVIGADGSIGSLQTDRSDRAAVVAFAGTPDAVRDGREPGYPEFRALGYDCATKGEGTWPLTRNGPHCRTVFFLNRRGGKLETFFTSSREYSERHGVRVGMNQAEAERLLHERLTVGCTAALHFQTPSGSLSISFNGGVENGVSIEGAHVDAFVVHGHRTDAGVFDCL
jgi:hypothetical protein